MSDAALEDHKVDFNVNWGGQTEPTDSVTMDLNFQADYWLWH